jgi:ADP-ribose pyrophosphatase
MEEALSHHPARPATEPERAVPDAGRPATDPELEERTVGSRIVHQGRYLVVRVDTILDGAGRTHERDVVAHPGAVAVIPLAGDDVLMVRQFRTPAGRVLLELPAGTLDRLEGGGTEDPASAAARELAEETGHVAGSWRFLGAFYSAPGFTDELMHLYLATDLEPIEGYEGPEPDERLALSRVPWREAVAMAEDGRIADAKSLVGLLRLARILGAGAPTERRG